MAGPVPGLAPIRLPAELERPFRGLAAAQLYFIDYVLKVGSRGRPKKRVAVVTDQAFFLCDPNGDIGRCVPLRDITRIICGGPDARVGLVIPTEGHDRMPSFDVLLRTGNLPYLRSVLRLAVGCRRAEACLPPAECSDVPPDQQFPEAALRLSKPEGWVMRMDDDVLDCVSSGLSANAPPPAPAGAPAAGGWGARGGASPSGSASSRTLPGTDGDLAVLPYSSAPEDTVLRALREAAASASAPSGRGGEDRQLAQVLRKLSSMEREVRTLRRRQRRAAAPPSAPQLAAPSAVWGDMFGTPVMRAPPAPPQPPAPQQQQQQPEWEQTPTGPLSLPAGSVPATVNGVEGFLVPRNSPVAAAARSCGGRRDAAPAAVPAPVLPAAPAKAGATPAAPAAARAPPPSARPAAPVEDFRCWQCGADLSDLAWLPRCSGCRDALYCGRRCQEAHWKVHSAECAGAAEEEEEEEEEYEEIEEEESTEEGDDAETTPRMSTGVSPPRPSRAAWSRPRAGSPQHHRGNSAANRSAREPVSDVVWEQPSPRGRHSQPPAPQIFIIHSASPRWTPSSPPRGRCVRTPCASAGCGAPACAPASCGAAPSPVPPAPPPLPPPPPAAVAAPALRPPAGAAAHPPLPHGLGVAPKGAAAGSPPGSPPGTARPSGRTLPSQPAPRSSASTAPPPRPASAGSSEVSLMRNVSEAAARRAAGLPPQQGRSAAPAGCAPPTADATTSPRRRAAPAPVRPADARRDRVYDAHLPAVPALPKERPPVPPPPPQGPGMDYDQLFQAYRQYYTDMLLGDADHSDAAADLAESP
eukprot:TRINITY_DN6091_c5_g1_i1.p1 TRINITY_DN6091_c5_g1~~TRINITY_DN6091_c5_g1_i1.p1  ORF type:complete len:825 (+),score=146.65 TRINITY_DN6091_c5_g1_i1:51-2477(+)